MVTNEQLRHTVDTLFQLFEQGAWDQAATLFSKDAKIIGQYGKEVSILSVDDFVQKAKHGSISKLGNPVYLKRRVTLLGINGFLEQHTSQLTIKGEKIDIPVCLVGQFDKTGAITLLEEYLDPSPIIAILKKN